VEALAGALRAMGARFWALKRRQPAQYAIIRRMHNFTSPYLKEAIDIDAEHDDPPHPILDAAMAVEGAEELIYVDIASHGGLWLEVQLDGESGGGAKSRVRWVMLVLAEGAVAVLPRGATYRLRMPGEGVVGLIRGLMTESA
jgi:hypothetical protein